MAKRNGNGSLGRKVKMSQPVAIGFDRYIALVEGKVVKGPTVPKMEVMEKWVVSGGRDIAIGRDTDTGLHVATLTAPAADGPVAFTGEGETMALATMEAIHAYLKAQPKPDPDGKDLPLFRRNGSDGAAEEVDDVGDEEREIVPSVELDPRAEEPVADESATEQRDISHLAGRTFLFVVNPGDRDQWQVEAPTVQVDGETLELVIWEPEGDDRSYDRGWYLHPDYVYENIAGEIRVKSADGKPSPMLVWSRGDAAAASPKA